MEFVNFIWLKLYFSCVTFVSHSPWWTINPYENLILFVSPYFSGKYLLFVYLFQIIGLFVIFLWSAIHWEYSSVISTASIMVLMLITEVVLRAVTSVITVFVTGEPPDTPYLQVG